MNESPRVDIITPTLNRAHTLPRVWHSLRSQTEQRFHWIIVDAASSDDTVAVVRRFDDDRITFVDSPRRGANIQRARGEQQIKSRHVVFLDSDDELYDEDTLHVMLETIESAPETTGCAGFPVVDGEGRQDFSFLEQDRVLATYTDVICERRARGEFLFIFRKEALDVAPWPESGMEALRHWAIARKYDSLFVRRPARIYHRAGDDNLTSAPQAIARAGEMARATSRLIDEHRAGWLESCGDQHGRYLFYAGMYYALAGERSAALKCGLASLQSHGPALKIAVLLKSLILPTTLRRRLFTWWSRR